MSDPKSPPLEDWMNFPPIGWKLNDPWETRLSLWRARSRKERRREAPSPSMRLLRDPRPTKLIALDYREALYWSRGGCLTADMESRHSKPLGRGFWVIPTGHNPGSPRFIPNIGAWIENRHTKKVTKAAFLITQANDEREDIERAVNEGVSAIDRLAGLA